MTLLPGLADHLADNSIGVWNPSGVYGASQVGIVLETMPQAPAQCIGIFQYGAGEASAVADYDEVRVQIRVRGTQDPRTSRDRAQAIYDLLHGESFLTLDDGTVCESVLGTQGGPVAIGQDGNARHEHVVNLRVQVTNPASAHRA
jgi:hypothetical protein